VYCGYGLWGVRGGITAQNRENAQNVFLNEPLRGEGGAFSEGWGALLAISSSPLVPYGPADRRGAGTRGVSGVRRQTTFNLSICLYIYLSIYPS